MSTPRTVHLMLLSRRKLIERPFWCLWLAMWLAINRKNETPNQEAGFRVLRYVGVEMDNHNPSHPCDLIRLSPGSWDG